MNSITVKNVYGAGTFDMDAASSILQANYYEDGDLDDKRDDEDYNYTLWTVAEDAESTASYIIEAGENTAWADITSTEAAELTVGEVGVETALMLLPQQLTGLDLEAISGGNSANEEQFATLTDEGSYLVVNCRVEYNGNDGTKYIVGTETEYANLYIPISTEWNPGYKYVYTLIFSADSGDPVKATVESVDEWNEYYENVPEGSEDNTGDDEEEENEDELTQDQLNARLIANQFATANAASITATEVTFINNEDYLSLEEYQNDYSQYNIPDELKATYYSYKELNNGGLLNVAIPDENGNYWRVATADEWNMLVFNGDAIEANDHYLTFWDFSTETVSYPLVGNETVNINGSETSAEYTFGLATALGALETKDADYDGTDDNSYPVVATRFKGTKQHAAYKYAPITLYNGLEALEITIKGLKSNEEVTFDQINTTDFWAEGDCFKVVLPALAFVNSYDSGFYDGTYGTSGWYGTGSLYEGEYNSGQQVACTFWQSPGELGPDSYGTEMQYPVRLIQCDSEGNLVLE